MKINLSTAFMLLIVFVAGELIFFKLLSQKTGLKTPEITYEATASSKVTGGESFETAMVGRVIDGDTVELIDKRRVRYIGIDTPEIVDPQKPVECFGPEAKIANETLVGGKTIRLEKDVSEADKYVRLLRYVYLGDVFVNDYLVRQGFAHATTYPPDVKYSESLNIAMQEAKANNLGLWSKCTDL